MSRGSAWTVRLTSFGGLVFGASHWHATLDGPTQEIEVLYAMSEADCKREAKDDYIDRVGTWTGQSTSTNRKLDVGTRLLVLV